MNTDEKSSVRYKQTEFKDTGKGKYWEIQRGGGEGEGRGREAGRKEERKGREDII
jgi:hypothetical protein